VAATIALTMVNVFSEGAQSKGRALADSLSQRLDDVVNFGLQLDQIEGVEEVLTEYRRLNPDVAAAGVTVNGRVVVHTDATQLGRYWTSDPANHEYRADLTPANHPRASTVVLAVPKAIVYWQVLRSVKNFAALFVASSLFAFLFMQVAQAIQQAMRSSEGSRTAWQDLAALDLVKPIFFLAVFVDHLAYAFLPQFVNDIVKTQGLPANYVAIPFMAYYLCFALALMPAGRYELRFGSRPLIIGGLLLTAIGFLIMAVAPGFELVVFARSTTGIGQGMLFIGIQSFVLAKSAREHRTKANTIIVFGFQAGMISGMAIGSLLVGQIAPVGVFLLGFLIAGLAVGYSLLVLPNNVETVSGPIKHVTAGEIWREIGWMLRDAKFRRSILLIGIPAKAVLTGVVLFAMPLILHSRGFAQEDIGQVTMIYAACVILSSAWAAKLADASSNTASILTWGAILTAGGLATIAACGWAPVTKIVHAQALTTLFTVTGIALIGVAHGLINAPVVTHVTQTAVAQRSGSSQVGAAYRFLERAGHTLGPIVMGQLFVQVGVNYLAFAWVALGVLALGVLFLISSRHEQSEDSTRPEYAQ
jgi:predicted MFS family arabinose efflux permease